MDNFKVVIYYTYVALIYDMDNESAMHHVLSPILKALTLYKSEFDPRTKRYRSVHIKTVYEVRRLKSNKIKYIFPKTMLGTLCAALKNAFGMEYRDFISVEKDIDISLMKCELKKDFKPRDYQVKCLDILKDTSRGPFTLIDLRTGMGKSLIGTFACFENKYRTGIVVLPKYIEKWRDDILKYTTCKEEDIYIVQGSDSLFKLYEEIRSGKHYDFIIFSLRTLYNFNKEESTFIPKEDLFNSLRIGTVLSDESHQETSALLTVLMLSNVKQVIGMSATFISSVKIEKTIQDLTFPHNCRISNITEYERYIDVVTVTYELDKRYRVKYKSAHGYSHIAYEQSIMKNKRLRDSYFEMIYSFVKSDYIRRRVDGDKCLIFCSTVNMCTALKSYISNKLTEEKMKLKVSRYTQEDPYENVMTSDITVSTVVSAGVAFDIPNLITCIQTITMLSPKANLQAIGRLRHLPNKETRFFKTTCYNIRRQNEIDRDVLEYYNSIAKSKTFVRYDKVLSPFVVPERKLY